MVKSIKNIMVFIMGLTISFGILANDKEGVISFIVPEQIGFAERPIVEVDIEIAQTRDLYVALQDMKTFKTLKYNFKRVSESGRYKFQLDFDSYEPGRYRWNAYLTPRGKNWNSRLADSTTAVMEVVNRETYKRVIVLGTTDEIKSVDWPDTINNDDTYNLSINFDITEPRTLNVKLLDSESWEEFGAVEIPVKEGGNTTLPFEQIVTNFPKGRYAWVIYLEDKNGEQLGKRKFGKHFNIASAK